MVNIDLREGGLNAEGANGSPKKLPEFAMRLCVQWAGIWA